MRRACYNDNSDNHSIKQEHIMIYVKDLCKTFRTAGRDGGMKNSLKSFFHREYTYIHALDHVGFSIEDGEMVGYIGPNGAGKSSTVKVLSGILTPDSGTCSVNGRVPWKERTAHVSEIGVVFGQRSQLWWDVPVIDTFMLLKDIFSVPDAVYKRNLDELTERFDLSRLLRTPTRQLSLGQRMRCEIAASLLHDPKILFLDEPTIGLDAVSKIAIRDFIKARNRERGTTVILTTHDMQDIEALTERILLIGHGRILRDGSLSALKQDYMKERHMTVLGSSLHAEALTLPSGMTLCEAHPDRAVFLLDTRIIPVSDAVSYISAQTEIYDLSVENPSLDTVITDLYRTYEVS